MTIILNLSWAVVALPLVGVGAAFLAESSRRAAHVGVFFCGLAFALSLVVLVFRLTHGIPPYENSQTFWDLATTSASPADTHLFGSDFLLAWGIRVDPLSVAFMCGTLFVSLLAQLHALVSQRGDQGLRRFFWVAGLLTFGVLTAVSSPNLFQLWLGWTISGVAAWMLAAHLWQRDGVGVLSTRLFVVLRVADLALLLGIVMTFAKFNRFVGTLPAPGGLPVADPLSFSNLAVAWHAGHIGMVSGVGARTLVVLAVLFGVAAVVRGAVGPFHAWLTAAAQAPMAGLAVIALAALAPAGILLARVYPLLIEAPNMLSVVALAGAAGAIGAAALGLLQRDLVRIGVFAVASQVALGMAALGMGGYGPGLFILFTAMPLAGVYFLAIANLARGYRSRDVFDCAGARQRMPRTTFALAAWAVGIGGLSLNTYSVLASAFRNARPDASGSSSGVVQALVIAGLVVAVALVAAAAFRVVFLVAGGTPARRRGFDSARIREAERLPRRAVVIGLAGAAAATLTGIPGVGSFTIGSARVPALAFSHFIYYGVRGQVLDVQPLALLIALGLGAAGAGVAWWAFAAERRTAGSALAERLEHVSAALGEPTPAERVAALMPAPLVRVGSALGEVDAQLLTPLVDAAGESAALAAGWLQRLRPSRFAISMAAALAAVAIVLAASVLAVTGHFPVAIR